MNKTIESIKNESVKQLIDTLKITPEEFDSKCNISLKLHPKSPTLPLLSQLYRYKEGYFTVKELIEDHLMENLREGYEIGFLNGKKIIYEEIKNNKISIEEIKNMSDKEVYEYILKNLGG